MVVQRLLLKQQTEKFSIQIVALKFIQVQQIRPAVAVS